MSEMKLVIGPKATSTTSLCAWLLMKQFEIPFIETDTMPEDPGEHQSTLSLVPPGRVPVLIDGSSVVWDSVAIFEYLCDRFPNRGIWPEGVAARAEARSIVMEVYNGLRALKKYAPMILCGPTVGTGHGPGVQKNIGRVLQIWESCRDRYEGYGMFLFNEFSAVDAIFAPTVARFDTYGYEMDSAARHYMDRVMTLPNFEKWIDSAITEMSLSEAIPA